MTGANHIRRFIEHECANWIGGADAGCIAKDGQPDKSCDVNNGLACTYFEACLVPLTRPEHLNDFRTTHGIPAVAEYERHIKYGKYKIRKCECGAIMGKNQRYCPECRERRRCALRRNSDHAMGAECEVAGS